MNSGYLSLDQPLDQAESEAQVEALFAPQFQAGEAGESVVFKIERGGLGATWVKLCRLSGEAWVLAASFSWAGHTDGDRSTSSFEVDPSSLFDEQPYAGMENHPLST